MSINLDNFGSATIYNWTHEHLLNVLTTGKNKIVKTMLLKNAFKEVRRDDFVPEELQNEAFNDTDLDIGFGEIIQKPTTIAFMLDLLDIKYGNKVLDIGTGSGWVAALLAMAVGGEGTVYSLERIQYLTEVARKNIAKYPELRNVHVYFRDGIEGLKEYAPFDVIYSSVAFSTVPKAIQVQLSVGGRMIVPLLTNEIALIERRGVNEFKTSKFAGYRFDDIKEGVTVA